LKTSNFLPAPFAFLSKTLLFGWALFLVLVALTFVAAGLFPGAAWIPKPSLLLALSLLLIISSFAYVCFRALRAVVNRLKH
jgi:hypothetical protein